MLHIIACSRPGGAEQTTDLASSQAGTMIDAHPNTSVWQGQRACAQYRRSGSSLAPQLPRGHTVCERDCRYEERFHIAAVAAAVAAAAAAAVAKRGRRCHGCAAVAPDASASVVAEAGIAVAPGD
jgi:hypothetical protein